MINLMLGIPGGGKSYEAVVFHILPALLSGRKVITNLPLEVERFAALVPYCDKLLEVRTRTLSCDPGEGDGEASSSGSSELAGMIKQARSARFSSRAFANVEDYSDGWRHEEKGFGPLYVVDEAHFALPAGETPRAVREWFSMHRHFNVDVLLITQTYGKIDRDIVGLVQMCYRVRKNIALGSSGSYTRKVQDGVRGEVVNTSIRRYEAKYFGLYRSHTQGAAVGEFNAADVRPLWKHWTFIGAGVCALVVLVMVGSGQVHVPWRVAAPKGSGAVVEVSPGRSGAGARQSVVPSSSGSPVGARAASAVASAPADESPPDPYAGQGLHLVGTIRGSGGVVYAIAVSQNGQYVMTTTDVELVKAGYKFFAAADCAAWLTWAAKRRAVTCDWPTVGPSVGGRSAHV